MENQKKEFLMQKARRIRALTVDEIAHLGQGHIGGSLSIVDALAVLYFDVMHIDPKNPQMDDRDRFVLSKGHGGPGLYATLAERGYFDVEMLHTLNQPGTLLPSHCDMLRTPGIDMTAGSLGQGISCAVGMAKAAKIFGKSYNVYCIIGDGESQEGQVWEAAMAAAQWKLDNFYLFLDYNKLQLDGYIADINACPNPAERWSAFGFDTQMIDGGDVAEIGDAIEKAKTVSGKPHMIVLDTIKGAGVQFVIDAAPGNHSISVSAEQRDEALKALGQ